MQWGDLITLEYGKPIKDKESVDGPIPVYGTNGQIGTSHLKPLCEHPSFILGRKGAYRGVHYSDTPFSVIDTAFYAQSISDKVDLKWAYYKFLTYDINRMDSGSAIPSTDRYEIYSINVDLPDLATQRKVVSVLELLDNIIQDNNKINDNLEQQAQAVFRQELLQNGELPPNWTTGSLLDIADYLNGLAMQKFRPVDGERGLPVLKIKELRQGFCDYSSELCSPNIKPEFIVHDGDVIFSWSGSLLVDLWCGGTCGLNQHLFKVTSVKYPKWFYYTWTAHHLARFVAIAADKATTMGHIKREDLAKAEVIIPDVASMERIGGVLQPIYNLVINQRIENRKLSMLRDSLLPKLMSGELDVSAIEL